MVLPAVVAQLLAGGEEPYPSIDELITMQKNDGLMELDTIIKQLRKAQQRLPEIGENSQNLHAGQMIHETAEELQDFVDAARDLLIQYDYERSPGTYDTVHESSLPFGRVADIQMLQEAKEDLNLESLDIAVTRAKGVLKGAFPPIKNTASILGIRGDAPIIPFGS